MYRIKYRRPEEMKDSGVNTVGFVPNSWKISNAQYYYQVFAGGTPSTTEPTYWDGNIPWINSGKVQNNIIDSESKFITRKGLLNSSTKLIRKNTTIMAMTGATCGNVGYLIIDSTANQSVMAFVNTDGSSSKYLFYYLMTQKEQVEFFKTGGAQGGINVDNGKKLKVIIPNLLEQQKIANFLDIKTAEFDSIISKKEKLIEKLEEAKKSLISEVVTGKVKIVDGKLVKRQPEEMKDSGVEWLGMIPKDWNLRKLSTICYMKGRIGWQGLKQSEFTDEGPYLITGMNFKNGEIRWEECYHISEKRYLEAPEIHLRKNDVLMTKDGTIGKLLYIDELPDRASLNSHLLVLRNENNSFIQKYLYYQLQGKPFKIYIDLYKTGTTFFGITQEIVGRYKMYLPPLDMQFKIVEFLDAKLLEIDSIIDNISSQIQKLKEAKQSLISETVTGKIDLRDWEIIEQGEAQ